MRSAQNIIDDRETELDEKDAEINYLRAQLDKQSVEYMPFAQFALLHPKGFDGSGRWLAGAPGQPMQSPLHSIHKKTGGKKSKKSKSASNKEGRPRPPVGPAPALGRRLSVGRRVESTGGNQTTRVLWGRERDIILQKLRQMKLQRFNQGGAGASSPRSVKSTKAGKARSPKSGRKAGRTPKSKSSKLSPRNKNPQSARKPSKSPRSAKKSKTNSLADMPSEFSHAATLSKRLSHEAENIGYDHNAGAKSGLSAVASAPSFYEEKPKEKSGAQASHLF